jgi:NAD/NADP transhydrogenase beta subunit
MEIKNFIKSLSVMHFFLVGGLSIFTIWVIIQINSFNTSTEGDNLYLFIVPIIAILGYFGSQVIFKKITSKIDINTRLEEKLKKYQSALHLKYALIEVPSFLGLFAYYSTGNALPLVISICLLAYLFVQRPTKENIVKCVPLSQDEKNKIQQV